MTPEIVNHRVYFITFGAAVPNAFEVSNGYVVDPLLNTSLYEMVDEFVDTVFMSFTSHPVELDQSFACAFIIYLFEDAHVLCYLIVPVLPTAQHLIATVCNRHLFTFDNSSNRASNIHIYIRSGLSTWLTNWFSLYRLMGNPVFAIVDEFEFSLFTFPSRLTFYTSFELEWKIDVSTFDTIAIAPDDIDEFEFSAVSIFPIAWRTDLLDVRWKAAFNFLLEQYKKRLPSITVLSDHLLCCCASNPSFEFIVNVFPLPIYLSLEEALLAPVVELVPERGTANCSIHYIFGAFEYNFESVTALHIKELCRRRYLGVYGRGGRKYSKSEHSLAKARSFRAQRIINHKIVISCMGPWGSYLNMDNPLFSVQTTMANPSTLGW